MSGGTRNPERTPRGMVDPVAEWLEGVPGRVGGAGWRPAADIYHGDDATRVRLEIAGVPRERIQVTLDGEVLRVRGVRRPPVGEGPGRPQQVEIALGAFERALRIDMPFDREGVRATLEDGILTITLPRRAEGSRNIHVETGEGAS